MKRPEGCWKHHDGPNRNGSWKDRVMAAKALPSQEVLRQLLEYKPETGLLIWRERGVEWFDDTDARSAIGKMNIWNSKHAGTVAFTATDAGGYHFGKLFGSNFRAHRIVYAWHFSDVPSIIDHANGDKRDNRIENLRPATLSQNSINCRGRKTGASGYRGVSRATNGWSAYARFDGRAAYLGLFATKEEAAKARDAFVSQHHGEFAVLNFAAAIREGRNG